MLPGIVPLAPAAALALPAVVMLPGAPGPWPLISAVQAKKSRIETSTLGLTRLKLWALSM
jgi:hypothetical protein